jgi:hypothetical protein
MSLTKVSYSMITGAPVNVRDFGAVGDGATDDTAAIQAAINYGAANGIEIQIPSGIYKTTAPLTVTVNGTSICGLGSIPLGTNTTGKGPIIRYYGTNKALDIGIAPTVNGTFIYNTRIENLRIEMDTNASTAMRVWHSYGGFFNNISIYGQIGFANTGLLVNAGVDNVYQQIEISGNGPGSVGPTVAYLGNGLFATLGYSNESATTTVFRNCYFHYCRYGANLLYQFNFENCIFEACDYGVTTSAFLISKFTTCYFEANNTLDCVLESSATTESAAIFDGCSFAGYSRQTFFGQGSGVNKLTLLNCRFSTSNAAPLLFNTSQVAVTSTGVLLINGCSFPAAMLIGGLFTTNWYPKVSQTDKNVISYRFVQKAVAANTAYSPMPTEAAISGGLYIMPTTGKVIGVNSYYTNTISAGNFYYSTKVGGSAIAELSFPTVPVQTANQVFSGTDILKYSVAAGSTLQVDLTTSAGFSPTGVDLVIEVLVAHGKTAI